MPDSISSTQSNAPLSLTLRQAELASAPAASARASEQTLAETARAAESAHPAGAPKAKPEPAAAAAAAESAAAPEPLGNIRFRYKVDANTHALTVFMLDTNAHQVVRTIPAEAMQHLTQGELLELWA